MFYLILCRLIIQNREKLQKAMTRFNQMAYNFLPDTQAINKMENLK